MGGLYLIGFSTEDRERLSRLVAVLRGFGWEVEWDATAPNKKIWPTTLMPRIRAAACTLVAWSSASVKNRWTAVEADVALESRSLVSVLLDEVELPRAFRAIDSVNLSDWRGDPKAAELEGLIRAVSPFLGTPVTDAAEQDQYPYQDSPSPRRPPDLVVVPQGSNPNRASGFAGGSDDEALDDQDLQGEMAFVPSIYGWALAWTLGLCAIGVYVRTGIDIQTYSSIYLSNHLYSAITGAAVGLIGGAFLLYALRAQRIWLSTSQRGVILLGWGFGGGLGLVAGAYFELPIMGVASGIVGFDIGWVVAWVIGACVGGAITWFALRRSNPALGIKDLVMITSGFSAGALIGWIGSWILLSMPVMLLSWFIGKLITEGTAPEVGQAMTELMSLAMIGAAGGAVFGLVGGLLLVGALVRAESQGGE